MTNPKYLRRTMLLTTCAALAAPSLALATQPPEVTVTRRNIMSFSPQRWQDHFRAWARALL